MTSGIACRLEREREREESLILPDSWKKKASQGSPDWNRIEEWLLTMERLKISLETMRSAAFPSPLYGVYQIEDV